MRYLALIFALISPPAHAQGFGDCKDPAYFQTFGVSTAEKPVCVVIAEEPATVNGQSVAVRALRMQTTDPAWDNFGREAIELTLDAFATWEAHATELGFKFPYVTILITDPADSTIEVPSEKFRDAWADAQGFTKPGECFVRFHSAKALNTTQDHMMTILAHELFHCVQAVSYRDQILVDPTASKWWVEGTASFFANLVHLTEADIDTLGAEFAKQIQTKPLTQLPYASMTFFAFLWQQGSGTMAQFLAGLPGSPGEAAQMEAVRASVGDEVLQLFAQAMVDGTIAMPDGTRFPALPDPSTTTFQGDGQVFFPSAPFTILQHALHFSGGNYAVGSGIEFHSRKQGTEDPWEPMPFDIAPDDCKDVYMLHIVRFDTDTILSQVARPLQATRYLPCWECSKLPKMDQCLVGTWRLSNDSLISFLQSKRITEEVNYNSMKGQIFLTMRPDGTAEWVAEDVAIAADYLPKELAEYDIPFYITVEAFGIDQAEWSGAEGTAHICPVAAGIDFKSTVESSLTGTVSNDITGMAQSMSVAYDCTKQTLSMQYTGPMALGEGAPRWMLERIK